VHHALKSINPHKSTAVIGEFLLVQNKNLPGARQNPAFQYTGLPRIALKALHIHPLHDDERHQKISRNSF